MLESTRIRRVVAATRVLLSVALLALPVLVDAAATVTGVVLLPDGSPAGGAKVYLESNRGGDYTLTAGQADAAGHFTITDSSKHPALWIAVAASRPGYALAWARASALAPTTLPLGAKPVTYTGRVCDPEGKPLAGAEARLEGLGDPLRQDTARFYFGEASPLLATTGPDGRFRFPNLPAGPEATLRVTAPGRALYSRRVRLGGASAPFVMLPEAAVSGKITRQGQPVPGMKLWAAGEDWGTPTVMAADDGSFRLEHLPAGPGFVLAFDPADEPSVTVAFASFTTQAGQAVTGLALDLLPGAPVSGFVRAAETGDPVPQACVHFIWRATTGPAQSVGEAWTDPDGFYHFQTPPGHLMVKVIGTGRATYRGGNMPADDCMPQAFSFDVSPREVCEQENFVITPPHRLQGRVLRPDGTPAVGAVLESEAAEGRTLLAEARALATTDAEGRFDLPFDPPNDNPPNPGAWHVAARLPAEGLAGSILVQDPKQPVEICLAPGAFLTGQVVDETGKSLPGMEVVVRGADRRAQALEFSVFSDAAGKFTAGPLLPGSYEMAPGGGAQGQAAAPWDSDRWLPATLAGGERKELPLLRVNTQGLTASGIAVDPQGRPVAGVLVYGGPYADKVVETDARGRFQMKGLPTNPGFGAAQVVAIDPMRPLVAVAAVGDGTRPLRLQLQAPGTVTGQAVNAAGEPLATMQAGVSFPFEAWAYGGEPSSLAERAGFTWQSVTTGPDGKFIVTGALLVPPGQLWLTDPSHGHQKYAQTHVDLNAPGVGTVDVGKIVMREAPPPPPRPSPPAP